MKKQLIKILLLSIPCMVSAQELTVFADLLYWHASEQATSTWATTINSINARTVDISATNIDFGWNAGFRGGIAYEPQNKLWDSSLSWTYFRTTANNSLRMGSQIVVPEFFSGFLSGNFFFGGDINWKILLNSIDWDLGHKFKVGKCFSLRPAIGIKGAAINQTINCNWDASIYTSTEQVTNKFRGLGPSLAIDAVWDLYKKKAHTFSLIGDFATAFMWGKWNINDTYVRPFALGGIITPTTITTSMSNVKLGTWMFDYILGLEWSYSAKYLLILKLGYEMQIWPNQLRLVTFQQLPEHGDLTLQGVTCGIRIVF